MDSNNHEDHSIKLFKHKSESFKSILEGGSGEYENVIAILKNLKRGNSIASKFSQTVSSNVSSGFKARTGGQDYKEFFNDMLRRMIANLGAIHGIPISNLVDLAVMLKDEPDAIKIKIISKIAG
jgi:hypothetical protein